MAITLVDYRAKTYAGSNPFTPTTGITVEGGDIVIYKAKIRNNATSPRTMTFGTDGSSTASVGAITELVNSWIATANRVQLGLSWAKVTTSGTLLPNASFGGQTGGLYHVSVWRGVDPDNPIADFDVLREDTTATTTIAGNAVTPSQAGDVAVSFACDYGLGAVFTKTGSFTEISKAGNTDESYIAEYVTAPDTSNITSSPSASIAALYVNGTVVLRLGPTIIPGTTVARGLYL